MEQANGDDRGRDTLGRGQLSPYVSGLRVYAPIGAWIAVGVSLVSWLATGSGGMSPAIGLAVGLGVLLVAGASAVGATAKTTNQSRYQTLKDWIRDLESAPGCDAAVKERLKAQQALLDNSKGPQWISGDGYINVSRSLAEVEVGLMDRASVGRLLDQARFDKQRLTGSTVDDRDALLGLLNTAIEQLTTAMSQVGPDANPLEEAAKAVNSQAAADKGPLGGS